MERRRNKPEGGREAKVAFPHCVGWIFYIIPPPFSFLYSNYFLNCIFCTNILL